jgi:N-acetylglucosaminyldiphosphoundecaprenol N-acetyl-beta-D-mannosaminyltransferase
MTNIALGKISVISFQKDLELLPLKKLLINTINTHSYNTARNDPEFAEALLKGGVLIPDGAGVVKGVQWLKGEKIERIAGWDLFVWEMNRLEVLSPNSIKVEQEQSEVQYFAPPLHEKWKVFFLGSSEAVLEKIKARAAVDYPNLEIYTYSPPYKQDFSTEDNEVMIEAVNAVQPDLLWIGMTAPKQEKWAYQHYDQLYVKGHIGTIGAVFDFYAGTVERAPLWWQEHSIEWLYRLIKEPRRMWRRYLIGNMKFAWYMLEEKLRESL